MSHDPSPVTTWRKRRQREGFVRVEVQVKKEDAALLREVAAALGDPTHAGETRAVLRERVTSGPRRCLKALLEAAPLDGIELDRSRDTGREIDW